MKILFDNIGFSLQGYGGLSTVWSNLLKRFIQDPSIDYSCIEYKDTIENPLRKSFSIPLSKIIKRRVPIILDRYRDLHYWKNDPLIFHSSHYRLCKGKNVINITTVHDFMYELYDKRKLAVAVHKWQKYRAIRKADVVVCISEGTKNDLLHFLPDVNPEKVKVIYNGVSPDYSPLENCPKDNNCLLYVGGRTKYKNFIPLVKALSGSNYHLIICGASLSQEEITVLNEALPNQYKNVVFPSNEELNNYYNRVKCLVYSSEYEGFGLPIVEAQSAGCPVIAYNASCIPEVLNDDRMLLEELTKECIENVLNKLDDIEFRGDVIAKGLENAKRFNWDTIAKQYIDLYKMLMNNK